LRASAFGKLVHVENTHKEHHLLWEGTREMRPDSAPLDWTSTAKKTYLNDQISPKEWSSDMKYTNAE
jgi:hypothetical protein